ncbi:hypothetical protein [Streptomyces sp. NPDC095817]|uniref:hypothetical protein n=1 Tax=Streptomyces sp. NPDC095817 TaxID=3155082 RepID=UPI0033249919
MLLNVCSIKEDTLPSPVNLFGRSTGDRRTRRLRDRPLHASPSGIHLTATLADDNVLVTSFVTSASTVDNQIVRARAGYLGDRRILVPREINFF